jgi:hypothetical protein
MVNIEFIDECEKREDRRALAKPPPLVSCIYFNVTGTTHIFLFGLINKYSFETYYFTSFHSPFIDQYCIYPAIHDVIRNNFNRWMYLFLIIIRIRSSLFAQWYTKGVNWLYKPRLYIFRNYFLCFCSPVRELKYEP